MSDPLRDVFSLLRNHMPQTLGELAAGCGELHGDAEVYGLNDDSRRIQPRDAFLCLPRAADSAKQFVEQAAENGASCVISVGVNELDTSLPQLLLPDMDSVGALLRRWFGTEKTPVRLYGVTGTDGKTSVTWMLRQAMQRCAGKSWAGTLGWVKEDGSFADIGNTTPSLLVLHALLAVATEQHVAAVCCEVSSHGIAQQRIAGLPFSAAVWTTLGHDHLQDHGGFEPYAAIKQSFVESVLAAGGYVVGNADQPGVVQRLPQGALRVGRGLFRDDVDLAWEQELPGMLRLRQGDEEVFVSDIPLGDFHAVNMACVAMLLLQSGVKLGELADILSGISAPPGRMQAMNIGRWQVFIDYAHTPEALEACLASARGLTEKKLIVVLGCGGDRDREKRPQMGRIAVQMADVVWLTSDNPRGELPEVIASEVESGMPHPYPAEVHLDLDRRSAIEAAVASMQVGDTLVIAGKGHENYMEIAGSRLPWSDADAASHALHAKSGATEFRACA